MFFLPLLPKENYKNCKYFLVDAMETKFHIIYENTSFARKSYYYIFQNYKLAYFLAGFLVTFICKNHSLC